MTRDDPQYDRRSVLKATSALAATAGLGGLASAGRGRGNGPRATLNLDVPNLFPLATGHYEGWAIIGDEKVSTGKFDAGDDLTFTVDRDLRDADKVAITIEPEGDDDATPSGIVYLVGGVKSDGRVDLSFPVDFRGVSGTYILATPTNGPSSHETAGIWFVDPRGGPSPGLASLPALPNGWTYEGWAVTQGKPISTGRFDDPAAPDDFDGHSGPGGAPPLPGEDLLQNAPEGVRFPANLADGASKAVISVEPDLDGVDPTGGAPFQVKPLAGAIPEGLAPKTPASLAYNAGTVPTGSAKLSPPPHSKGRGRSRGRGRGRQ